MSTRGFDDGTAIEAAASIKVRLLLDTGAVVIVVYGVHDTVVRTAVLRNNWLYLLYC